jgi:hypothetical protein
VDEHRAYCLPLIAAAGDGKEEDVAAQLPGVLGPLKGDRDNIQAVITVLPAAAEAISTCAPPAATILASIVKSAAARPLTGTPLVSVTETTRYIGSLLPGLATPCAAPSAAVPRASTISRAIC